jgi:hypothetical protein
VLPELEPTQVLQAMLAQTEMLVIMEPEHLGAQSVLLAQTEMLVLLELDAPLGAQAIQE